MSVKKDKLQRSLGGIAEMKKVPELVFVIDTNYESLAIAESSKLGIPIIAILDSNSNPDGIDFPIPGNDDATRALKTFCELISDTISMASKNNIANQTSDIGETDILAEDLDGLDDTGFANTDKKEQNTEVNENNTSLTDEI